MRALRRVGVVAGIVAALMVGGLVSGLFVRPAQAIDIGTILKVGGIILAVSTFGDQINTFITRALGEREAGLAGATKVVPIFSVGRGAYVGAAQVIGVPANVRQVRGVAALNVTLGRLAGSALVPIGTSRPGRSGISRIGGVGISAVIDFHV